MPLAESVLGRTVRTSGDNTTIRMYPSAIPEPPSVPRHRSRRNPQLGGNLKLRHPLVQEFLDSSLQFLPSHERMFAYSPDRLGPPSGARSLSNESYTRSQMRDGVEEARLALDEEALVRSQVPQ